MFCLTLAFQIQQNFKKACSKLFSYLTKFKLQVFLQLIQLLREFAQHGAQESNILVLLSQSQLHLMKPEHGHRSLFYTW